MNCSIFLLGLCVLGTLGPFVVLVKSFKAEKYDEMLNTCIDTNHHKSRPGPESELFKQCSQWKKNACCHANTTEALHESNLFNFNMNHCPHVQASLSESCMAHFIQDDCFYQCEPNVGPWRVSTTRKFASERFQNIPLCESQCQEWFDACRYDYTCVVNWPKQMKFTKDRGNICPVGKVCRTFEEVYEYNASLFCNQVWDGSFIVVPDSESCMKIFFDPSEGNPNERVAVEYVKQLMRNDKEDDSTNSASFVTCQQRIIFMIQLLVIFASLV